MRFYIKSTVFLTGATIMIFELLAAKILAPYFGSSLYTWTSVISVTMISLALGYRLGGSVSDHRNSLSFLYSIIAVAAVYGLTLPLLSRYLIPLLVPLGLKLGSFLATVCLLTVPLTCLAMVAPFTVKSLFSDSAELGITVGNLYALSTIGSLAGTVVSGFFLIPSFANETILIGTSLLLLGWAAAYFFFQKHSLKILSLFIIPLLGLPFYGPGKMTHLVNGMNTYTVSFDMNSHYGRVQVIDAFVKEQPDKRYLVTDGLIQNIVDLNTGFSTVDFNYALVALSKFFVSEPAKVLCLGMGAGIIPVMFQKKGADVDAVEINPKVVRAAREYFGLTEGVKIHTEDGRYFVKHTPHAYDVVVLDTFLGDSVPAHLFTLEFFRELKSKLNDKGVVVINFFGKRHIENHKPSESLWNTLAEVFSNVGAFALKTEGLTNLYVYATDVPLESKRIAFDQTPQAVKRRLIEIFSSPCHYKPKPAPLLTDAYNPLEFFDLETKRTMRETIQSLPFFKLVT